MCTIFLFTTETTQPHPQVFSVNGALTCSGLQFDVISLSSLLNTEFSKFGHQWLVMVNYVCAFSQSELRKHFEWIIILSICMNVFLKKYHNETWKAMATAMYNVCVQCVFTLTHRDWIKTKVLLLGSELSCGTRFMMKPVISSRELLKNMSTITVTSGWFCNQNLLVA